MPFVKTIIRVGVIGTLVGGGLIAVAGPERVGAALTQARDTVNDTIDRNIDDPVKMRAQLRKLESQYPERITRVRQDLATLDTQTAEYERELAVAERVVELAQADLEAMHGLFDRAEHARAQAGHGAKGIEKKKTQQKKANKTNQKKREKKKKNLKVKIQEWVEELVK
eukprot:TRINITY_DN38200_c0_g1_i2.p3 TRINITY_DN38200_c0_g1~~TRINITY_DN38200_c0_g1_i2.p3  ORF type:complete len:168 (-),score=32.23 TRINITY_DN38200_c0_g1_i2:44-547(-)